VAKPATAVLDRMADKFTVGDGCWLWTGAKTPYGYGKILTFRSIRVAHRVLYEALVGPVPEGMELDHLCRTPACVRPDHLEPVSHRENISRALWKTHCVRGHALTNANTYRYSYGRVCRLCQLESTRKRYAKRKGEARGVGQQ
jgi:hypothetical protein